MKQLLWTIQTEDAFKEFERTGILRANEDYLFCEDYYRFAYDWLSDQMMQRISAPPEGVRYPVWAWYQWEGKRKRRDLRTSGYAQRGTPMVQITFEADPASFMLSDFDAWHTVLAKQYLADNESEWDNFYESNPNPDQKDVQASWDRIFDITHHTPGWDCAPERKSIQATLWQIEMPQVKKIEHFIAK